MTVSYDTSSAQITKTIGRFSAAPNQNLQYRRLERGPWGPGAVEFDEPLSAETAHETVVIHRQKETLGPHLTGMGPQCLAFGLDHGTDIDGVSYLLLVDAKVVVELWPFHLRIGGCQGFDRGHDRSAVDRRLKDPIDPDHLRSAHPNPMDLDVIGMAVPAVIVVDRQQFGRFLREDQRQSRGSPFDRSRPEGPRGVVGGLADHAGIEVSEELDPADPEHLSRSNRLVGAPRTELLSIGEHTLDRLTMFAPGTKNNGHPMPGRRRQRHHSPSGNALIIRMRMKEDKVHRDHSLKSV